MQPTRLGPYVIDKLLGKGGMGSVYAATDPQTGQHVAIKALSPHLAAAEGFRERFEAEIESLKTLRHDGIVRLYGYGEQDGILFYSMELVDGISLEDELKAGRRFNWREVTNIAIQLALALKHAHDHGIVHRDIKPANILLKADEHVKLADFGIARLFGTTSLTTAGGVLGTADYMSPEQADGRPVTARCDQYSLGGVMYALLAGRPPFRAKNLPQMLQLQRFASAEPVRRYAPDTPEQLERVIAQLLEKEPASRFPNTQVLARHLQAMVNALTRPAADDFALGSDPSPITKPAADILESLSSAATQAEAPLTGAKPLGLTPAGQTAPSTASQNAATMAAAASAVGSEAPSISLPPIPGAMATAQPVERETRFTTVEEEQAALTAQQKRSWLLVALQLVVFAAVLAVMGGAIAYVSRPPTADKLYTKITTRAGSDDEGSLGKVENEIDDFLKRFPDDARSDVLRSYKERIDLDKLERKLQREARGGGSINTTHVPAEQLYLEALGKAATAPEKAIELLTAIVDLYDNATVEASVSNSRDDGAKSREDRNAANQTAGVVRLAQSRIQSLRADLAKQRDQHLAALNERLEAAEKLKATKPERAATMYRAIVKLHEGDAWAAPVVDKARSELAKLEKN